MAKRRPPFPPLAVVALLLLVGFLLLLLALQPAFAPPAPPAPTPTLLALPTPTPLPTPSPLPTPTPTPTPTVLPTARPDKLPVVNLTEPGVLVLRKQGPDPDPEVTAHLLTGEAMTKGSDFADFAWVTSAGTIPPITPSVYKPGNGAFLPQRVEPCRAPGCAILYAAYPVFFSFKDFLQVIKLPDLGRNQTTAEVERVGKVREGGGGLDLEKLADLVSSFSAPRSFASSGDQLDVRYQLYHRLRVAPDPLFLAGQTGGYISYREHGTSSLPTVLTAPTDARAPDGSCWTFEHFLLELSSKWLEPFGGEITQPRMPGPKQVTGFPQTFNGPLTVTMKYKPTACPPPGATPTPPPQPPVRGKAITLDLQPANLSTKPGFPVRAVLDVLFDPGARGQVDLRAIPLAPYGRVTLSPTTLYQNGLVVLDIDVPANHPAPLTYGVILEASFRGLVGCPQDPTSFEGCRPFDERKQAALSLSVVPLLPDLICTHQATRTRPGEATLLFDVINYGLGNATSSFNLSWTVSQRTGGSAVYRGTARLPPLNSTATHTFNLTLANLSGGNYEALVEVDSLDEVQEYDEAANTCTASFSVAAPAPTPTPTPTPYATATATSLPAEVTPTPTPTPTTQPAPGPEPI